MTKPDTVLVIFRFVTAPAEWWIRFWAFVLGVKLLIKEGIDDV
jgi:hypothetical protein